MRRYHPILVALHWLVALMIVASLVVGFTVLAATSNSDPAKLTVLAVHMAVGIAVLALMVVRLVVRLTTARPPQADTGSALLNRAGVAMHWLLYIVVLALAASGLATANLADLPAIVFGGSGAPLPADFDDIVPRAAHGVLAIVLVVLVAGHAAAGLWHQFVRGDRLFARMWFGRRD